MVIFFQSIDKFYCKPGISKHNGKSLGLIATKNIKPNTKILNRSFYKGQWQLTKTLKENDVDSNIILQLQDLFKNKKLFMQNENKEYTFVPEVPINEFHAELFLNWSNIKHGNVIQKSDGYYTICDIEKGDEFLIIKI